MSEDRGGGHYGAAAVGALVGAVLAMGVALTLSNRETLESAPVTVVPLPLMRLAPTPLVASAPEAPRPAAFVVGEGVAARMVELHDVPASDEVYLPIGREQFSLTLSLRGALYVYSRERNATDVFVPSDRAP